MGPVRSSRWVGLAALVLTSASCSPAPVPGGRVPIAVLGDSDSHAYHDSLHMAPSNRGGPEHRQVTFQWTEILERLRGDEVDLGEWGLWGTRRRYSILLRALGQVIRVPKKLDYRYNMALPGATCRDLMEGSGRQAAPLTYILKKDPDRWSSGVVVIRIGINSLGGTERFDSYARTGLDEGHRLAVAECLRYIREAVRLIREASPSVRIALVGISDDTNGAPTTESWQSPAAIANIREVLDHFDRELEELAQSDPNAVFVEDREWFVARWGGRDSNGLLAPRALDLGGDLLVSNRAGDHPMNAITADGHASTVVNALWANHLLDHLNSAFRFDLTPIRNDEIVALVDPDGRLRSDIASIDTTTPPEPDDRTSPPR